MRSIVALTFSLLVGCGGATQTDLLNSDASTNDGGSGTDGGGSDARADGPAADCKTLLANVNDLRNNATKCNGGSIVCDVQVEDLCCPLTVTGPASRKEVTDFEAAVKAAKAGNCMVGCPAIPCAAKPTLKCSSGICQQF